MSKKVIRLFEQFQPETYSLILDIDKDKMTFRGSVEVKGRKVGRPSERITFHQKELKFTKASITRLGKSSEEIDVSRINSHKSYDEVRLHSDKMLYPGEYLVKLKFSGQITKAMHGIYPSYYDHDGKEKSLVSTQFESHFARQAFPCIDEPEAKAVFNLTLVSPKSDVAISNTPVQSSKTNGNRLTSVFEPTPKMSSYLMAFVVGEMHCIEGKTKDGIAVKSWARVNQPVEHLRYANEEAIKVLEFFSDYFKTPFPLKKLDLVAVTEFESLAMENWGLIIFREVGLLTDPKNRSLSSEQLITLVIAHEVSHQWFGNLVTMRWWDDLWLNESFASIMENIAPDKLHPDWQQWEDFTVGRVLSSSHRDIYKDVQSVGVKIKHPDEILTLFDPSIVYGKGARILSMLYDYIGEDKFREGLQLYFKDNAYTNTDREELWQALSKVCGKDIAKLMTPWIEQSGQPLLSVEFTKGVIKFNQQRFLMDGEDKQSLWPIPLLSEPTLKPDILVRRKAAVPYKAKPPIFNINGSGHYIVKYLNKDIFSSISSKIIKREVSSISRIALINDMLLLARAGDYKLPLLLDIVSKCETEPRDSVWSMYARIIGQAQVLTDGDKVTEENIKKFKNSLSQHWYKKLGWRDKPKDDPNTLHLRTTALALAVAGENKNALAKALELYSKAGSVEKLPAEQRALIAAAVVRHGQKNSIKQMMDEYSSSQNPDVRESITAALCSTKDEAVAKELIKWGLSPGGAVRQQDIDHWFAFFMRNHYTRREAWQWLTSSWNHLIDIYSGGKHMDYFTWYAAGPLSTPDWQKKFKDFFTPMLGDPGMKRNILIALSEIQTRVKWRKREEKNIVEYFAVKGWR